MTAPLTRKPGNCMPTPATGGAAVGPGKALPPDPEPGWTSSGFRSSSSLQVAGKDQRRIHRWGIPPPFAVDAVPPGNRPPALRLVQFDPRASILRSRNPTPPRTAAGRPDLTARRTPPPLRMVRLDHRLPAPAIFRLRHQVQRQNPQIQKTALNRNVGKVRVVTPPLHASANRATVSEETRLIPICMNNDARGMQTGVKSALVIRSHCRQHCLYGPFLLWRRLPYYF